LHSRYCYSYFLLIILRHPSCTLFPYTTLFRSRREAGSSAGSLVGAVRAAALDVQRPILFSLLIIIAAYIPLLTLERVERRLFTRSEEHTSELQSRFDLVCRLLLEKKK